MVVLLKVLGNAGHYLGIAFKQTIGRAFSAINEVSDFSTRLARTGLIAADQGVDLGTAFKIANDKGDKVFDPSRIDAATRIYGEDAMSVAMKVAGGMSLSEIQATGSDAEKLIASTAAQKKDKDCLLYGRIRCSTKSKVLSR
jgi:hypothetical protein